MALLSRKEVLINNDFYNDLHEDWYTAEDHPIALLRAENAVRIPWIIQEIESKIGKSGKVLDVGCGGGFLTNALAQKGFAVTGIDLSESSLEVARKHDKTKNVNYLRSNAYDLPFTNDTYDVVCAMDILEHVDNPEKLIKEASRVLKPGGLFFFHTFNRNVLSYLLVIKGVDWFVPNAPKNMHVYSLFIKPEELREKCARNRLEIEYLRGFAPKLTSGSLWKMLGQGKVKDDFPFVFTKSLLTGYCGVAKKVK